MTDIHCLKASRFTKKFRAWNPSPDVLQGHDLDNCKINRKISRLNPETIDIYYYVSS